MDRPMGVSGVTNPQAAAGGDDPESIDDIRTNAPQTVLTLGRAVSIDDYQNFASTYSGIEKAFAIWIPSGPNRGVFLTVTGVGGVIPDSGTLAKLKASLQAYGNPLIPITVVTYLETLFTFTAKVQYDRGADHDSVQAIIQQTLLQAFGFEARSFGQGVSIDEIAATIQGVPGVTAVNVTDLQRVASSTAGDFAQMWGFANSYAAIIWMAYARRFPIFRPLSSSTAPLTAYVPVATSDSPPGPAEILVIDPTPGSIVLGVMS
jgi:hypothetical protein